MTSLERELVALGRALELPETPELAPRVRAALEPRRGGFEPRRWALAVALALVAGLAATLAIPDARSALLRVLHIGGERVVRVDELPPVDTRPAELTLGEQVSLADARERAGFLQLPASERAPDRVYLGARGTVWLLWGDPGQVRLLLGETQQLAVGAPPLVDKLVTMGTRVEPVTIDGRPGWFLSGEPHLVYFLDTSGEVVQELTRLAENVLVWERNGVTFRLEGALDADEAVEIAESLR